MNTHKLPNNIAQPSEFYVLKKSPLHKEEYKISTAADSYYAKSRNLLFFAVLYGIIIGSLMFMLLNA